MPGDDAWDEEEHREDYKAAVAREMARVVEMGKQASWLMEQGATREQARAAVRRRRVQQGQAAGAQQSVQGQGVQGQGAAQADVQAGEPEAAAPSASSAGERAPGAEASSADVGSGAAEEGARNDYSATYVPTTHTCRVLAQPLLLILPGRHRWRRLCRGGGGVGWGGAQRSRAPGMYQRAYKPHLSAH